MNKNLKNIKYFVFCSGKSGSQTLYQGLSDLFGEDTVLHVHSSFNMKNRINDKVNIFDLILDNSKKFNKIYVIDSYREPIERGISSFFQNIESMHYPNWENVSVDTLIDFFNEEKLNLLELYHSYHESWSYFKIPIDVKFDFEKGYILKQHENIIFIKTRLRESYRWDSIFSEILDEKINFNYVNSSEQKKYYSKYLNFKEKYKLPLEFKEKFIKIMNLKDNELSINNPNHLSWIEMKKFMTKSEIDNYIKKWFS